MKKKIKTTLLTKKRIRKTLTAGVLACVCCFGAINSSYAATASDYGIVGGVPIYADGEETIHIGWNAKGALYMFSNAGFSQVGADKEIHMDQIPRYFGTSFADLVTVSHQDIYDALNVGNGIIKSDNKISAKAGTNVTVNSNGISVTGNGTVASGNTGLIDGGKLYTEVRPSDNGNYEEKFSILL